MQKTRRDAAYEGQTKDIENDAKMEKVLQFNSRLRTAILEGKDVSTWKAATKQHELKKIQHFQTLERAALSDLTSTSSPTAYNANSVTSSPVKTQDQENSFRKLVSSTSFALSLYIP
eukprot:scaffold20775_cov31-Prasinocladus_malaysianus.AAC.1